MKYFAEWISAVVAAVLLSVPVNSYMLTPTEPVDLAAISERPPKAEPTPAQLSEAASAAALKSVTEQAEYQAKALAAVKSSANDALSIPARIAAKAGPVRLTVYFSPKNTWNHNGDPGLAITDALATATDVYVQAYSFTSHLIADALLDVVKRGGKVTMLMDYKRKDEAASRAADLLKGGVNLKFDPVHPIFHDKVILIDPESDKHVIFTGSYNFTSAAENVNAENLVEIENAPQDFLQEYKDNFAAHWVHAVTK